MKNSENSSPAEQGNSQQIRNKGEVKNGNI